MAVETEIAEYLEDQAVGTVGTDIFAGQLPDTPDACVAVIPYAGRAPERNLDKSVNWRYPRVQVSVRGAREGYAAARAKIDAVNAALDAVVNTTIEGVLYQQIDALSEPFLLRRDGNNRPIFVCNFECWRVGT